jgi:hypothetical protein
LTHIFEIKNNLGIDIGIVPKISGYNMQKHEDRHQLWAHASAIYGSSNVAFNMRTSRLRSDVSKLSRTLVMYVSAYIQNLPNVTCDDMLELDVHLTHAPMRLPVIGVDLEFKQASLILMSSFTWRLGHWAQQDTEVLYKSNLCDPIFRPCKI